MTAEEVQKHLDNIDAAVGRLAFESGALGVKEDAIESLAQAVRGLLKAEAVRGVLNEAQTQETVHHGNLK